MPGVVAFSFQTVARHVDRALALQIPHHAGNCQLRWNIDQHVHVIDQHVPLLDPAALLLGQPVKHPAKFPPHDAKKRLPTVLRDKYNVVFALPFCVTQTLVVLHGSCGSLCALDGSQPHSHGGLPEKSNSESLPRRAGGFPIGSLNAVRWDTGQRSVHYDNELFVIGNARSLTEFEEAIMAEAIRVSRILGPQGGNRQFMILLRNGDWVSGISYCYLLPRLEAANVSIQIEQLARKRSSKKKEDCKWPVRKQAP